MQIVLISWLSQQRQATSSTGGFAWDGSDPQQSDTGERKRQTKGLYTHTHTHLHHDVERVFANDSRAQ